jgi:hypothetical protein
VTTLFIGSNNAHVSLYTGHHLTSKSRRESVGDEKGEVNRKCSESRVSKNVTDETHHEYLRFQEDNIATENDKLIVAAAKNTRSAV